MSSFFSAIANLLRRLFRPFRRAEETGYQQHDFSESRREIEERSGVQYRERARAQPPNRVSAQRVAERPASIPNERADEDELTREASSRRIAKKGSSKDVGRLVSREPIATSTVPSELRQLVYQATYDMPKQRMHAGQFGSRLRQADPSFSYEKYGFTKLIYLLEAVPDIVTLERVNNPGAAPAYYVRPVADIQQQLIQAIERYDSEDGWVHVDSVAEALAASEPKNGTTLASAFSVHTYGFSQISAFLKSRLDLIEFKADSPTYVRLLQARESAKPKLLTTAPKRPRLVSSDSPSRRAGRIVHLSKFAGFSPQVLSQKVSELAAIALLERWYFGPQPPDNFAYPILKSYLRYTFIRLQHEQKVITSANEQYRAFNTGLLDKLLRPIYALLSPSFSTAQSSFQIPSSQASSYQAPSSQIQWNLSFCIPGEGSTGKMLVANFIELPVAANYLSDPSKVFYHLSAGPPEVDWHHIVKDNMERLPPAFLSQYAPANFTYRDTQTLIGNEFHTYKKNFAEALDADPIAYRNIVSRLEEALSRTLLKTQINYKTAVPTYYPNINSIDLLLPICLVAEDIADCAIVARRSDSGKYIGHTILTMRQAYNNARLICKLDEHWLSRAMTLSQEDFEEEDDDSEEFDVEENSSSNGNVAATAVMGRGTDEDN